MHRFNRGIALLITVTMLMAGLALSATAGASSARQAHAKHVRKHKQHKRQRKHRRKGRRHTRRPVATLTGGFVTHPGSSSTASAPSTSPSSGTYSGGSSSSAGGASSAGSSSSGGSSGSGGTSSSGGSSNTGSGTGGTGGVSTPDLKDVTVSVPRDVGGAYIQLSDDDPSTPDPAVSANGIRNLTVRLHVDADPAVTPITARGTATKCQAGALVNEVISVTAKGYVGTSATVEWDEIDSTGKTVAHRSRNLQQAGTTVNPVTRSLSICVS